MFPKASAKEDQADLLLHKGERNREKTVFSAKKQE